MRHLLVITLLFAFGLAQATSNPPPPTPPKAGQEQKGDTSKAEKDAKPTQGEPKDSPLSVTINNPVTIQKSEQDRNAEASNSEHKASNEWWLIVWTAVLACITLLLAGITGVLAKYTYKLWLDASKTSERQAIETQRSLHIAKESANAATMSAQAAIGVELPRFVVSNIQLSVTDSSIRTNSGIFTVETQLANHGRTEAVITVDCLNYEICEWLDPKPAYLEQRSLGFGTIIKPAEQHRIECQIPAVELDGISNGRGQTTLWVYGFIEYRDFLEKLHETGFVAAWIPPEDRFMKAMDFMDSTNISMGTFVQEGPEAYTYNRYTKNHDHPQT